MLTPGWHRVEFGWGPAAVTVARTPGTWWHRWHCADCGRTSRGRWGFAGLAERYGRHHWRAKHERGK